MVNKTSISVDMSRWRRRQAAIIKKLDVAAQKTTQGLAQLGMRYAKKIAPYYTGKTARLIRTINTQQNGGNTSTIIAPNSTKERTDFNLVTYMHSERGASSGHFKSGEPQFMFRATDYLNTIKKRTARAEFTRIKL